MNKLHMLGSWSQFKRLNRASRLGIIVEFHPDAESSAVAVSLFNGRETWPAGDPMPCVDKVGAEIDGDMFENMCAAQKWGFARQEQLVARAAITKVASN